jgi:hypothetical protein
MPVGPLDDARLKGIEDCLNKGRFDDAQRRLAALASEQGLGPGLAYLSARLLFHRGRLDAATVATRLREVLAERPDFSEAKNWLETVERSQMVTRPPPQKVTVPAPRLETPRIPLDLIPTVKPSLGPLEPPKSELPTLPAPPPDSDADTGPLRIAPTSKKPSPWDPLETALASGRREAVLSGLDKLAARALDEVFERKKPKFAELAGHVSSFLARTPVTRNFAPFDLTLDSVERLDAIVALLVPPAITSGYYALRMYLSVYLGECVREASNGSWEGTLAEPEGAAVKRDSERYVPWTKVDEALGEGRPLRKDAGPPPHPAAEPPDEIVSVVAETPTPWDPRPWPSLAEVEELTRSLASSTLGVWAARCLKIPLDRTPASLVALDRYATLLNPRGIAPSSAHGWVRLAAVLTGSYVADLLCLHSGGRFSENDAAPLGPLRFEVLLPDGNAVYPVLFAYDRLSGKRAGTFAKFFEERR